MQQETVQPLGQRVGLSEKDVQKVNLMYADECNNDTASVYELYEIQQQLQQELIAPPRPYKANYLSALIKWVEDFFSFNLW